MYKNVIIHRGEGTLVKSLTSDTLKVFDNFLYLSLIYPSNYIISLLVVYINLLLLLTY